MASKFILLGAGNSTGVPWLHCVMDSSTRCSVCAECMEDPKSKNVRNNPSALLQYAHPDGRTRNILIDCGKTFRDCMLKHLPAFGIKSIDAVLITHPHADAIMGLDDVRDVAPQTIMPVYLSEPCFLKVSRAFTYLVQPPATKGLFIASVDWRIIKPFVPFVVEGLVVTPLPVEHGEPRPMFAFEFHAVLPPKPCRTPGMVTGSGPVEAFGAGGERLLYISDVAGLPSDTRAYLCSKRIDILIIDALGYKPYPTHYSVKQALLCALDLRVRHVVFVGMNHRIDYYAEEEKLQRWVEKLRASAHLPDTSETPGDWLAAHEPSLAHLKGSECRLQSAHFGYDGYHFALQLCKPAARADIENEIATTRWKAIEPTLPPTPPSHTATATSVAPAESGTVGGTPSSRTDSGSDSDEFVSEDMTMCAFGWQRPEREKLKDIDTLTPKNVVSECDCSGMEPSDSLKLRAHIPGVINYLSVPLPGWEEGESVSKSAEQAVTVRATNVAGAMPDKL